jgi:TetR/AcrR family transcriptional repressor of nem operon
MRAIPTGARAPEATRRKILNAAFAEFYKNGYQAGSLNQIVGAAGTTKGALFHHFAGGKQELGYAVVDEIIEPLLKARWLDPLTDSTDPLSAVRRAFRQFVKEDIESGAWLQGCPLNNLAQEMSPLDEGFRTRIEKLYATWRQRLAVALSVGIRLGRVRKDISPRNVAGLIVAAQMGIWGTGKYSKDEALMVRLSVSLCEYLDRLRP